MNKIIFGKKEKQKAPPLLSKQRRKQINNRWKRFEDWWYKQTGWRRLGHIRRGVECADLDCEMFSLDVTTSPIPKKLLTEMADALNHRKPTQIAVVAFAPKEGLAYKEGIVCLRIQDFLDLHCGDVKDKE